MNSQSKVFRRNRGARTTEFGLPEKFSTYELPYRIQIRDNRQDKKMRQPRGIVFIDQTIGGGYATTQTHREAVRLARKIVRLLNNSK